MRGKGEVEPMAEGEREGEWEAVEVKVAIAVEGLDGISSDVVTAVMILSAVDVHFAAASAPAVAFPHRRLTPADAEVGEPIFRGGKYGTSNGVGHDPGTTNGGARRCR